MSRPGTLCESSRAMAISGMAWPRPRPREKNAMPNVPGSNGLGGASDSTPCMCVFLLFSITYTCISPGCAKFRSGTPRKPDGSRSRGSIRLDKIGFEDVEAVHPLGLSARELAVRRDGRRHPGVPVHAAARLVPGPAENSERHRDAA